LSEEEKKEEKPKRRKMVQVRVAERKGQSVLVEWLDGKDRRRVFVPANKVEGDKVEDAVLDAGIPYGVPWREFVDMSGITPEMVERELRRRGVWTAADMERNTVGVSKAIAALISPVVIGLRRAAREK
jgi:hypothetical protein